MYPLHGYALAVYVLVACVGVGALWIGASVSLAREEARSARLRARLADWL